MIPLSPEVTTMELLMTNVSCLVRLLITFAKKLSDFTQLPQAAQVSLLKGKTSVLLFLRECVVQQ